MKATFVLAAVLACASSAAAQETRDTFHLDQVVVSASRLPQPLSRVPAAVSVISSADFARLGLRNAADVLRTVSGAALVQGGSYGALASLFLRGGESDYVQVLLDGVQINSPGELFDYAALSLEKIERIEVVKGPASVLYGSDAVAGVVHLFSQRSGNRPRTRVTMLGGVGNKVGSGAQGNFKSVDLRADVSGATPAFQYSGGVSHFGTEGALAYNNQHQLTSGSARMALRPGQAVELALTARVTRNLFHYPTDGSGNLIDRNQFHEANSVAAGADLAYQPRPRTEMRAQLSWNRNRDHIDDAPDSPADTLGFYRFLSDEDFTRRSIDLRLNQTIGTSSVFTVGGEWESQQRAGESVSGSSFGDFESSADNDRENTSAYAQLVTSAGGAGFQLGARLDHNDPFGDFFTYRAGATVQLARMLRLRLSAGTAFKEPRFFEQFSEGFGNRGNPELKPEQSRAYEVGADFEFTRWRLAATAFTQTFRDLIQYTFAPDAAVNYSNIGQASADGVELEAHYRQRNWSLRAGVTVVDTRVDDAGDGSDPLYQEGERLIRRPRQTATLAIHYAPSFQLGVVIGYVGERDDLYYDESFTPRRVQLPAYTKLDLNARTPSFRGFRGLLKFENLLDERYEEIRNFPARGRVVFLGFSMEP